MKNAEIYCQPPFILIIDKSNEPIIMTAFNPVTGVRPGKLVCVDLCADQIAFNKIHVLKVSGGMLPVVICIFTVGIA